MDLKSISSRGGRSGAPPSNLVAGALALAVLAAVGCGDDGADPTPSAGSGAAGTSAGTSAAGTSAAGTGTSGSPAAGSGAAGTGSGGGATFTQVYDMIFKAGTTGQCVMCHGLAASAAANGNLGGIKDKAGAHAALVGKASTSPACMGKGNYVMAGDPANSLLLKKLQAMPPCGSRMPLGSTLSAAEIKLVSDWITAGAKND